jgi:hypothetical protein
VGAALEGALQFRGLASSPSGCGGLRARRALRQELGGGGGGGGGNASAALL